MSKGIQGRKEKAKRQDLEGKVWEMYLKGKRQKIIAAELDITQSTVSKWIKITREQRAKERDVNADNYIEVELERLDVLYEALMSDLYVNRLTKTKLEEDETGKETPAWELTQAVNTDVVDKALKVHQQRAKYLKLEPNEVKVTHVTIQDIILASMEPLRIETVAKEGRVDDNIIDVEALEVVDNE